MNASIDSIIFLLRGQRVMLDQDLAMLYGVGTKVLNQALKRNVDRFPEDFAFRLTEAEWNFLRSQNVPSNITKIPLRSQIVTLDTTESSVRFQSGTLDKRQSAGRGEHSKYLPHVFTEHGVVMLANVLRSKHAVKMSIEVVRVFIQMRKMLVVSEKFDKELHELKNFVLKHAQKSDQEFRRVWKAIEKLSTPPKREARRIGFDLNYNSGGPDKN